MSSNTILAIIFIIILALAGVARNGLKKPVLAKVMLGAGALVLTGIGYALGNDTVPAWILALSGIILLVDAWFSAKKQK